MIILLYVMIVYIIEQVIVFIWTATTTTIAILMPVSLQLIVISMHCFHDNSHQNTDIFVNINIIVYHR